MQTSILLPFLITVLAGAITVIGGILAVCRRKPSDRFLSAVMGFSCGIMLYTAFTEILHESTEYLNGGLGGEFAPWVLIASFFGGILIVALSDKLLPHHHHHDEPEESPEDHCPKENIYLYKTGMATMVAIGLHNFPEGLAMFTSMLQDVQVGLPLVLAVCLHNIPVGLAISAPIYAATKSRKKAVLMSLVAGLFAPLGAAIGYLFLRPILNDVTFGVLMGAVAGIMVYVAINEIYPAARKYGKGHSASYAMITGMAFIAVLLQLTHTH